MNRLAIENAQLDYREATADYDSVKKEILAPYSVEPTEEQLAEWTNRIRLAGERKEAARIALDRAWESINAA